ncbi:Na+/H+ antiporter NhaC family protein [Blautia pseudococcoides]|uniref:Na+/H+ antiporter NhaC family protein n=1 Tax=Blautia pseudococcoides TaxID=1796616 RepID=UPI00148B05B5|nr:Na+/H+ antiporter NhaC family protein [Blautia pseudococcoides]QJU17477.1 Na+/H+ antiporter NhaC family protein [Blautia pseudococcoides]
MKEQKRGNSIALLPIGVFLIIFIGAGILFHDFYTMPAIVGFLIALAVAFFQNRKVGFQEKVSIISKGIGEENIVTMCLIFLAAGAFSGSIKAAGGVESTVNLGLSIMPSSIAVVGLFVIGCFISISMGTSVGTITAMAPIGVGIAEKTGIPLPICMGAIVCGAMFGDNLSMISDTTIAAVRTQGCEMKDKFRENFFIVLPAAIITAVIFFFIARGNAGIIDGDLKFQIIKVIPYLVVLIGALVGINVFIVLITGTVLSLIVGVGTGAFAVSEMFQKMGDGITGMYDITVISIIVAAIVALVKEHGGIEYILYVIKKRISGERGGEFGISVLALLVDCCTANNTVAIVMAGPIAKEISEEFKVSPKRSASLLDIFASVGQGMIPYGAQLLAAASLSGLTPMAIMPYLFYPILMGVSAIGFIIFRRREVAG